LVNAFWPMPGGAALRRRQAPSTALGQLLRCCGPATFRGLRALRGL